MIYGDVQTVLDAALYLMCLSYWLRKTGADADEYIVYTNRLRRGHQRQMTVRLIRNTNVAVRYYFKGFFDWHGNGQNKVQNRAGAIIEALENNGYSVPFGAAEHRRR